MRNSKYTRKTTIALLLFLIFLVTNIFAAKNWQIQSIGIKNEDFYNQVKDSEPEFFWQFDKPIEIYNAKIDIYQIGGDKDSLVFHDELKDYSKQTYKVSTPHLLQKGKKYRFQVRAKRRNLGETRKSFEFTINSVPQKVKILEKTNQIFDSDSLCVSIVPSKDNEISQNMIGYNVKISDFQNPLNVMIDTLVQEQGEKIFIPCSELAENGQFFMNVRAYDGVEYSDWSDQYVFFMNRYNEPPNSFSLMKNGKKIIFKEEPKLTWEKAVDPEYLMGGEIKNYIVETSTFEDFTILHEKKEVSGGKLEFYPQKIENHRKYFWRVTAVDSDSMSRMSEEIGVFFLNKKNDKPGKAKIVVPGFNRILKPADYIFWKQARDEDKWDRLYYNLSVYQEDSLVTTILLNSAKIDSAIFGLVKDLSVGYDNSVRLKLSYLLKHTKLIEGEKYRIEIETFDGWGGRNIQKSKEATFIFDDNVNCRPLAPVTGFSPDSIIISSVNPTLTWTPARDPDINDKLKYEILISTNPTFRTMRYISETTGYGDNFFNVPLNLMENKQYFWKVRSVDLMEKKSNWSKLNTFWVNAINEAPIGPVTLLYPKNYKEFNSESSFWWTGTVDNDPGDRVRYLLELAPDKNFRNKIYSYLIPVAGQKALWPQNIEKPTNALGIYINENPEVYKLVDNRMYYWRVIALDNNNLSSLNQSVYPRIVYNIKNDPPDIPAGFSPGKGEIVSSGKPTIYWQHSVDPDFLDLSTTLSYQLEVSKSIDFPEDESWIYNSNKGDNFVQIEDNLTENSKYFFRINAFDSHDSSSGWSLADSFYVNEEEEVPETVREMIPRDSILIKSSSVLLKWNEVSDPDPDYLPEKISYTVKYIANCWIGHKDEKKNTNYVTVENGGLSLQLEDLDENNYYSYQIKAMDESGMESDWSKVAHFCINEANEYPGEFTLLYPGNGQDSISTNPEFYWYHSVDPDPEDNVIYNFLLSEDSLFQTTVKEFKVPGTEQDSIFLDSYIELKRATKYYWKVAAEDNSGAIQWGSSSDDNPFVFYTVGYHRNYESSQRKYVLHHNIPNPFYTSTRIDYEVGEYGNVKIEIFNVLGGKIKTLVARNHSAGVYNITWNGTDESGNQVPGGMYLCRMTAKGFMKNKKMVLLR